MDFKSVTQYISVCFPDVTDAVKTISVMEGDSVTLNPDVTEVQKYMLIQWMFESTRIAELNRLTQTSSTYDSADGRFTDCQGWGEWKRAKTQMQVMGN